MVEWIHFSIEKYISCYKDRKHHSIAGKLMGYLTTSNWLKMFTENKLWPNAQARIRALDLATSHVSGNRFRVFNQTVETTNKQIRNFMPQVDLDLALMQTVWTTRSKFLALGAVAPAEGVISNMLNRVCRPGIPYMVSLCTDPIPGEPHLLYDPAVESETIEDPPVHTIGIYRESSFPRDTYHIFDSNKGELVATRASATEELGRLFKNEYSSFPFYRLEVASWKLDGSARTGTKQ